MPDRREDFMPSPATSLPPPLRDRGARCRRTVRRRARTAGRDAAGGRRNPSTFPHRAGARAPTFGPESPRQLHRRPSPAALGGAGDRREGAQEFITMTLLQTHGAARRTAGFTLIELMIAVAVVAILAAVAYPSYVDYIRRSHRADAQSFLQEVAARQQQFLLDRRAFASNADVEALPTNADPGLGLTIPPNVKARYDIVNAPDNLANPPVFVATATPKGSQAADPCGALSINQAGTKTKTGTGNCW
jgi:type IV pilus assembly protein PilE